MTKSIACAVGLFVFVAVAGVARAQTTQPVEWKVSEGGNGHWYAYDMGWKQWDQASVAASGVGAHLATLANAAEESFCVNNAPIGYDYWLGAKRSTIHGAFAWVTGEPFAYTNWYPGQPDDLTDSGCYRFGEQWLEILIRDHVNVLWNDEGYTCGTGNKSILEWDTDCNADGIVDYGQILRGELADDNHNSIPDVCETSVTGVLPPSVPSQGGVTITINGRNFPDNPTVLVGGTAATNVVRVSATRITATTPAGLPGMTSISVNGFTLPDAFYYRPECGSDLDQNGEVDTADISIILLDFGPCYQAPVAAPTKGPLPPALPDAPTPTSDAPQTR